MKLRNWFAAMSLMFVWCVLPGAGVFAEAPVLGSNDPDAGDEAGVTPARALAGLGDPDCVIIGDYINSFSGTYRYRGNVYLIDQLAVLKEIKMQLAFSGTTDLYVCIHQCRTDGSCCQYVPCVVILNAIGDSVPRWYSTGEFENPVLLEPGFDYAIGFAWGSKTIAYGRDNENYPAPFEMGYVLGLVAFNLSLPPDPLVPDCFTPIIFQNGVYSMQLCFEPEVGACCKDCTCTELYESECTGPGSFFYGEKTRCAESECDFGACCRACGECGVCYTPQACAETGGTHCLGADCPDDPQLLCPKITGACCHDTQCTEQCQAECVVGGGVYRGDRTDCTLNVCAGACCVRGGCLTRTRADCEIFAGNYKGDGTSCSTLPPELECGGACCYGFSGLDFCDVYPRRDLCACDPEGFPYNAYRGDGTDCSGPGPCTGTYRKCCLPNGTCINTTDSVCNASWMNGEFNANITCIESNPPCACTTGACCFDDGSCKVLTERGCTSRNGTWIASSPSCTEETCPASFGACCMSCEGCCEVTTESQCLSAGGSWVGAGTGCGFPTQTCPGFGACWVGECCDTRTRDECADLGGTYCGPGGSCGELPCACVPAPPQNAGADPDISCEGGCSTLIASAPGAFIDWYIGSCGGTPVEDPNSVCPSQTTTYYARSRDALTGCESERCADVIITVHSLPPPPEGAAARPPIVCPGGCTTLGVWPDPPMPGPIRESIAWYTLGCGGNLVGVGDYLEVCPSVSTTYYARFRDPSTECWSRECASVEVRVPCSCGIDCDVYVDLRDAAMLQRCFCGAQGCTPADGCAPVDVDCDGDVDLTDWKTLRLVFGGPPDGTARCCRTPDLNRDGRCNATDVAVFRVCLGESSGRNCCRADLDCDGMVDEDDPRILEGCLGFPCAPRCCGDTLGCPHPGSPGFPCAPECCPGSGVD